MAGRLGAAAVVRAVGRQGEQVGGFSARSGVPSTVERDTAGLREWEACSSDVAATVANLAAGWRVPAAGGF